jgi:predicted transcriptional regulator
LKKGDIMALSTGDLSVLVFKRETSKDLGEISLDGPMLSILMELDGTKSLGAAAKKLGMNMATLRAVMARLVELNLVERVQETVAVIDGDFFEYLQTELSLATGPIAEVLIEDAVEDLGHQLDRFPSHRAAELVDLLARQIQREEKMTTFKQNMISKMKEKGF